MTEVGRERPGTFKEVSIIDAAWEGARVLVSSLHIRFPLFVPVLHHEEPGPDREQGRHMVTWN